MSEAPMHTHGGTRQPTIGHLDALLEATVDSARDRLALVGHGRAHAPCGSAWSSGARARMTWRQLHTSVSALASGLAGIGVGPGVRVAICLDNCIEHPLTILAVWRCGATAVLVNASTPGARLARIVADADAGCLIMHGRQLDAVPRACIATRAVVFVGEPDAASAHARGHAVDLRVLEAAAPLAARGRARHPDEELAVLLYTSGSTGEPKGVMHGHAGLLHVTRAIAGYLGVVPHDVILQVLPLSFGYGLTQLLLALASGCTLVLERSFTFPQAVAERLATEGATLFAVVPTMAALLAQTDLSRLHLSKLRALTNAGAALPPALARALADKLPHVDIIPMYGQTECIRASHLPPAELGRRPGSVGRGLAGQRHWLVDERGARLPPGSTGELVVAGPHVMLGYWNRPADTARKVSPGPADGERTLRTGDLFHQDADGWLTFVARTDDIIKTRGEKVSPREVEDALCGVAGVQQAAVAGVPHPILGEAVHAWVVPQPGATLDTRALARACAATLTPHAVPHHIEVVTALPRTPNGKVDTRALRASAARQGDAP